MERMRGRIRGERTRPSRDQTSRDYYKGQGIEADVSHGQVGFSKEIKNEINWQAIFDQFSCVIGNIWRARKKKTAAYFSEECFGCPGGAFWLGFMKPQTETIIRYVSTGIPGKMEGELYCDSPEVLRQIFEQIDPRPAPKKFCVVKPLTLFEDEENPEIVAFFARPESLRVSINCPHL